MVFARFLVSIRSRRGMKDYPSLPRRVLTMADLEALTSRQREIYQFIRSKIQGRGYGPTVREIGSSVISAGLL